MFFVVGWLAGMAGVFVPPADSTVAILSITLLILLVMRAFVRVLLLGAGVLSGGLWAKWYLVTHLPLAVPAYAPPLMMTIKVVSLPVYVASEPERLTLNGQVVVPPEDFPQWQNAVLRISAYGQTAAAWSPDVGEHWRLLVKVKPVHGWVNFVGFDYESWAFQQGVQGRATVRQVIEKTGQSGSWHALRAWFAQQVAYHWQASPFAGVYDALSFGERSRITPQQWQLFQQTGTVHLMAISGLHMGMVSGLGFVLFFWMWRWLPVRLQQVARVHFAAWGMLLLATGYLFLSGFGVPAVRAWLMVGIVALLLLLRRHWHPWALLATAAFLITLVHPPSVLSPGFWLSFIAVALIFAWMSHPVFKRWGRIRQLLGVQGVLALGLMPVVGYFFQQAAGLASVVNVLLVPLLPLMLVGLVLISLVILVWLPGAQWLLQGMDRIWQALWSLLQLMAELFPPIMLHWPLVAVIGWLLLIFGVLLRWPKYWWAVWAGVALIALLGAQQEKVPYAQARITLLEVGQGQAIVVETRNHVLVYDAGPRWGRLDGGEAVLSHLRAYGWQQLDRLVISHHDRDHAGGAETVLAGISVKRLDAGQPDRLPGAQPCDAQRWVWDGVIFSYLPRPPLTADNDRSCLLKVSVGNASFLVTGDLSAKGEHWLVQHVPETKLRANVLVAGHHGSATSNSVRWLTAVEPEQVAVSAGYGNFFRHPAASVKARWLAQGVTVRCTGCEGALRYQLSKAGVVLEQTARSERKHVFRHACKKPG